MFLMARFLFAAALVAQLLLAQSIEPSCSVFRGTACEGEDCEAEITCSNESWPVSCNVDPSNSGDGAYVVPTTGACVARGTKGITVRAHVVCDAVWRTFSIQSNSTYLDNQVVSASCPAGSRAVSCNCYSPWTLQICGGISQFEPEGNICSLRIGSSSGRRRGIGDGAGAKIFAVCSQQTSALKVSLPGTVDGICCFGDDCPSKAICPVDSWPVSCQSEPANTGDGSYVEPSSGTCVARGGPDETPIRARAVCSTAKKTFSVQSDPWFEDSQVVHASCPEGSRAISCHCYSPWTLQVCGGVSDFEPSDDVCSRWIGSSSGRRRGTDGGSGAKIFVLCLNLEQNTTQAAMSELSPTTGTSSEPVSQQTRSPSTTQAAILEKGVAKVATSQLCTKVDCTSKAICPVDSWPVSCQTEPANTGDGSYVEPSSGACVARGSVYETPIRARAVCSTAQKTFSVQSDVFYLDNQVVHASCPDGSRAISCHCHSFWTLQLCGGVSEFEPSDDVCSRWIGSSTGRRRGTEHGAGAKIFALCSNLEQSAISERIATSEASQPTHSTLNIVMMIALVLMFAITVVVCCWALRLSRRLKLREHLPNQGTDTGTPVPDTVVGIPVTDSPMISDLANVGVVPPTTSKI